MSNPIEGAGRGVPGGAVDGGRGPAAGGRSHGGFAAALERAASEADGGRESGGRDAIVDAVRSIERGKAFVDRAIRAARNGRTFSNEELIAVQAGVYRYTHELELASKLVDKATNAVKTTLQSQQ
jgi:hypothetical protein